MKILSNPMKISKISQVAEYLSPRIFGAGRKQNIIGLSTRRDLFKSEEFSINQCIPSTSAATTSKHTQVNWKFQFWRKYIFLTKFAKTEILQFTCVCLLVVAAEVGGIHWKLLGFEEISSSRCARYILNFSRSNSKKSYDLRSAAMKTSIFAHFCPFLTFSCHFWPFHVIGTTTETAILYTSKKSKTIYILRVFSDNS